MSSNTNQFDIASLLAQLQQQQQQQQQTANDARTPLAFSPLAENSAEALLASSAPPLSSSSTMNPLMSNYLQAMNIEGCTPLSQAATQMNCNMPAQDNNGPVDLQSLQNLLTSAKMLSSVNPKLAAAAIEQALALASQLLGQASQPNVNSQASQQESPQGSLSSQQGLAPFALLSGSSREKKIAHMQYLDSRNLPKDPWSNMPVLVPTQLGSNLTMDMPALLSSLSKSITNEVSALSSMHMGTNHLQDMSASNQQNNTHVQDATQILTDHEILSGKVKAASQPKQPSMSSLTQSDGNHDIGMKTQELSSYNSLLLSSLNQQHQNGPKKNSSVPNLISVSSFKQIAHNSQNPQGFSSAFISSSQNHRQQQQPSKGQMNSSPPTGSSVSSFTQRSTNHAVKKNAKGSSHDHCRHQQSSAHKKSNHYIKSLLNQQQQLQQHGPYKSVTISSSTSHGCSTSSSALVSLSKSIVNKSSAVSSMQSGGDSGSCNTEKRANSTRNAKAHHKGPQTALQITVSAKNTARKLTSASSESASSSSPSPGDIAVWKNWDLAQLESYVQNLKDSNQPIPNALQFLVDAARKQEMKRDSKRESNRKSAKMSRKRKKELIGDLVTMNEKFRRRAFILSFLPDPVIAIAADGEIKFCGAQVERVFGHKVKELIGANIQDIITPRSRSEIWKVFKNVLGYDIWQQEESPNNVNAISSQSTDGVSTPLSDENGSDEVGKDETESDTGRDKKTKKFKSSGSSVSSITERSMSVSTETSTAEDSDEPAQKKISFAITNLKGSQCSNEEDCEGSGYSAEISVSVEESLGKGRKRHRFAPAYTLQMIRHDLTTVVCEMTCSVLGEDNELSTAEDPKDLLLSLRPLYEDKSVGEELRFLKKSILSECL